MKAWLLPITFLALSLAAQAQDAPAPPNARQACKADYQKFCSGVSRGGGRIADCLNAHKSDLSTACQEVLNKSPPGKDAPPPADQPPKSQ
jgi:hypothetical protein